MYQSIYIVDISAEIIIALCAWATNLVHYKYRKSESTEKQVQGD